MTARTQLIRCSPEALFAALAQLPAQTGRLGTAQQARLVAVDAPRRARLIRRSPLGSTRLDLTVSRGAHGSITQVRCEAHLGPLCHLPGPLKHLMTGTYAHQLLIDLDDAVRRYAGPVA
jgi:ribosomal protein S28E/S33